MAKFLGFRAEQKEIKLAKRLARHQRTTVTTVLRTALQEYAERHKK